MRRAPALVALCVFAVLLSGGAAIASPSNDNFAAATSISEFPFSATMNIRNATVEDGEPPSSCGQEEQHTVWFTLTPAEDMTLRIDTSSSDFDNIVALWTGSGLDDLTEVLCTETYPGNYYYYYGGGGGFTAQVAAGTTYYLEAAGYSSNAGNLVLSIQRHTPTVITASQRYKLANGFTVAGSSPLSPCNSASEENNGGTCFDFDGPGTLSLSVADDITTSVGAQWEFTDRYGYSADYGYFCGSIENLEVPDYVVGVTVYVGALAVRGDSGCLGSATATSGTVSMTFSG